jgi:hypothetical protein
MKARADSLLRMRPVTVERQMECVQFAIGVACDSSVVMIFCPGCFI